MAVLTQHPGQILDDNKPPLLGGGNVTGAKLVEQVDHLLAAS